jgi:hypothetical protein
VRDASELAPQVSEAGQADDPAEDSGASGCGVLKLHGEKRDEKGLNDTGPGDRYRQPLRKRRSEKHDDVQRDVAGKHEEQSSREPRDASGAHRDQQDGDESMRQEDLALMRSPRLPKPGETIDDHVGEGLPVEV